jgi:outer membrane murein-binding lipoprotein Lpp
MRQAKTTGLRDSLHAVVTTTIVYVACLKAQTYKSHSSDLQALTEKMQRLAQAMQELKGEIGAAEQIQPTQLAAAAAALRTLGAPTTENEKAFTERGKSESTIDVYGFIVTDMAPTSTRLSPNCEPIFNEARERVHGWEQTHVIVRNSELERTTS